jgi:hypothetical protein
MIRFGILPLVLVFAAPIVIAQSKSSVLTLPPTPNATCPVGMQARHGAGIPVGMNAERGPTAPHAQKIHLTMTNLVAHEIVSAQFVVHGYSNKGRAMNLANSSNPDLAKTVELVLDVKGKSEASSDLSLSRFAAVTSIDLNSITYADGNAWHTPSPEACSIAPDMLMLVASSQ